MKVSWRGRKGEGVWEWGPEIRVFRKWQLFVSADTHEPYTKACGTRGHKLDLSLSQMDVSK